MIKSIKRNAKRNDLLVFLLPWFFILTLGAVVSLWEFARGGDPELKLSFSTILGLLFIIFALPMALVIPLFMNRIKMEEKLLIEEFGAEYERYRETSKKLIPFLF